MSASDDIRVLAGDCTVVYDGTDRAEHRGEVVAVCKPDNTVLVHDAGGYQPVAWLTRADAVACSREGNFAITAQSGDECLRVVAHRETGFARYPASDAGVPVGDCPDCDGSLVRAAGTVTCLGCGDRHGLPGGATVSGETCDDCGLPRLRVARGRHFDVCLDRDCDPLDDAVRDAFDREWDCPDCDGRLRVIRRGGLLAGCEHYPDCDVGFGIPRGTVEGRCDCGLPAFETATGRRCLDPDCERC